MRLAIARKVGEVQVVVALANQDVQDRRKDARLVPTEMITGNEVERRAKRRRGPPIRVAQQGMANGLDGHAVLKGDRANDCAVLRGGVAMRSRLGVPDEDLGERAVRKSRNAGRVVKAVASETERFRCAAIGKALRRCR